MEFKSLDIPKKNQSMHLCNQKKEVFDPFPSLPATVRQYKLIDIIGRGGYGIVYKAVNMNYNVEFAVKCLNSPAINMNNCLSAEKINNNNNNNNSNNIKEVNDNCDVNKSALKDINNINNKDSSSKLQSFEAEVQSLVKLDHPHVIRIYDYFREGNLLFLVLEYCDGGSLEDKIRSGVKIPIKDQISYCSQIISALNFCHQMSIAHRDIKAANILFDHHGRVKIADFGLSQQLSDPDQKMNKFNGSYLSSSPEILRKVQYNPFSSDIWSLGVLFYRMATNEYPWPIASKDAAKKAIVNGNYPTLPPTHPLVKTIKSMLVVDADDRVKIDKLAAMPLFREMRPPSTGSGNIPSNNAANSPLVANSPITTNLTPLSALNVVSSIPSFPCGSCSFAGTHQFILQQQQFQQQQQLQQQQQQQQQQQFSKKKALVTPYQTYNNPFNCMMNKMKIRSSPASFCNAGGKGNMGIEDAKKSSAFVTPLVVGKRRFSEVITPNFTFSPMIDME